MFLTVPNLPPSVVESLVLSALILQILLRNFGEASNGEIIFGYWRQDSYRDSFLPLPASSGNNSTRNAKEIREEFKNNFCVEGAIDWKWEIYYDAANFLSVER